jgi:hypothetical protein
MRPMASFDFATDKPLEEGANVLAQVFSSYGRALNKAQFFGNFFPWNLFDVCNNHCCVLQRWN